MFHFHRNLVRVSMKQLFLKSNVLYKLSKYRIEWKLHKIFKIESFGFWLSSKYWRLNLILLLFNCRFCNNSSVTIFFLSLNASKTIHFIKIESNHTYLNDTTQVRYWALSPDWFVKFLIGHRSSEHFTVLDGWIFTGKTTVQDPIPCFCIFF